MKIIKVATFFNMFPWVFHWKKNTHFCHELAVGPEVWPLGPIPRKRARSTYVDVGSADEVFMEDFFSKHEGKQIIFELEKKKNDIHGEKKLAVVIRQSYIFHRASSDFIWVIIILVLKPGILFTNCMTMPGWVRSTMAKVFEIRLLHLWECRRIPGEFTSRSALSSNHIQDLKKKSNKKCYI